MGRRGVGIKNAFMYLNASGNGKSDLFQFWDEHQHTVTNMRMDAGKILYLGRLWCYGLSLRNHVVKMTI
jgi:hypothetical protein